MNKLNYYFEILKKIKSPLMFPKVWNYCKYRVIKRRPEVKFYTPQIAGVMLINRCNLQCNYCGCVRDGIFKAPKEEITLETIKKAFSHKLLKNALFVDLVGGEPLLCEDLVPIVKFLSNNGFLTRMSTNGLLLLDKIEELKNAGITIINISIYPENFEKLKTSLKQINRIFPVNTSFVLTKSILKSNLNFVFDAIDLSAESGCKYLKFIMYLPRYKGADRSEIIMEDSAAYKNFKKNAEEKYKQFVVFPPAVKSSSEKKCSQLWQNVNLNFDGSMLFCCGNINNIQNVNLFQNNLEEIYNCEQLIDVRKNLLDNSAPPLEMCMNCNLLFENGW